MSPRTCLVCGSTEPRTAPGQWVLIFRPRIEWFCREICAEAFLAWTRARQIEALCGDRGDLLSRLTQQPLVRLERRR